MTSLIATSFDNATKEPSKINLLGLSVSKMKVLLKSWGEPAFRAVQLIKWIHQYGVDDFDVMTNISKSLREKLKLYAEIMPPEVVSQHISADGTSKWLIRVAGGSCIETVLIPEKGRSTLCVSSQVGCSLDCSFCSTGKQGFNRDLSAAEIIGQLWVANKSRNAFQMVNKSSDSKQRVVIKNRNNMHSSVVSNVASSIDNSVYTNTKAVSNVVMMGMGEPLMNFDNVIDSMQLMLEDNAYGLSKRRVTLSTSGVVPAIDRLADYVDVSLAISLHAANDKLRNELVPINKKYPIKELLRSANEYLDRMPDKRRKLTIEYTLMSGINDRHEHAIELAQLLRDTPCKINLIPFNPFEGSGYKKVSNSALSRFREYLQGQGYITNIRTTRGDDIAAACGQLAGKVNDKTNRQKRYEKKSNILESLTK